MVVTTIEPIKQTRSLCPECMKVVDATIYEENGKVLISKECDKHGRYVDVYWSNIDEYRRAQRYSVIGDGVENPQTRTIHGHPLDCGLCPNHKSATSLGIIDVTNRCNLRCPICFANANVTGTVYEPTVQQVHSMIKTLRSIRPVPPDGLQFSGGEPTIREDLPDLIRVAKNEGFDHIEVNTNGIRLAESVDYCKELADAGVSSIYLQFDGIRPEVYETTRGASLWDVKVKALDNCRKGGLDSVVLVPTIVKGVNDDQLGAIIEFAHKNFDIVRCVNFQPVSITGRISHEKRGEMRITIPDCTRLIEEQTQGALKTSDFYPVPVVVPVAKAVGAIKGRRYSEFTVHEHCGMATFLLEQEGKLVPITRFIDVDAFMDDMKRVSETAARGSKRIAQVQLLSSALRHAKVGLVRQLAGAVLNEGSYNSLGNFMRRVLMIGLMHFQDPYNFDLERLERCGIHYAVPDGRIIPFCAMNSIYRPRIEEQLGVPLKDWQEKQKRIG